MTIAAQGYLEHLKSYLNMACYGKTCIAKEKPNSDQKKIVLSEQIEGSKERRKVEMSYQGDAFAIKLDQGNYPLFHFLENEGRLWSKRCDFVVFHCKKNQLHAYCIEFKEASTRIPYENIMLQLKAAEAWCVCLNRIIAAYCGESKKIHLSKYVFTACRNPDPDLDDRKKYLKKYPDIRHYLFDEVNDMALENLDHSGIKQIA